MLNKQKHEEKSFIIKYKYIVLSAYLYMLVPIVLFLSMWLKWYLGIPMAIGLIYGLIHMMKTEYKTDRQIVIPYKTTVFILLVVMVYVWATGQGGFFFQYSDNHLRNAIFRDLVDYKWPVIYDQTNNALVYYLLHWLIPATIGKLTKSFLLARIALYIWTLFGVVLVLLLLWLILNVNTVWKMWIVAGVFMGWSGINIIGGVISNVFGLISFDLNTFRWWTNFGLDGQGYGYMFRSNCDQLCSVYNQTVAPWLAVPLLIDKPKQQNFMFLGFCIFAYAPFPFLGLVAIMFFYFVKSLIACKTIKIILGEFRKVFSLQNVMALCIIFPVFALYYTCNIAATSGSSSGGIIGLYVPLENFTYKTLIILLLFYFIQFGVYVLLIRKDYSNDALFKFMVIGMCVVPLFQIGTMADFCWNVSVPFFFLLMIYCIKYIFNNVKKERGELIIQKSVIGLSICFTLAFLDPFTQIAFGFRVAYENKTLDLMCRGVGTLSDKVDNINFLTHEWKQKPFYKWLAKVNDYQLRDGMPLYPGYYRVSPKQNEALCLKTDGAGVFVEDGNNQLFLSIYSQEKYRMEFIDYQVALDVPQCTVDEKGTIWVWGDIMGSPGQEFDLEEVEGYYMIGYQDYALTYNIEDNTIKLAVKTGENNQLWSFQ